MKRQPEPEQMTAEEVEAYSKADYSESHNEFVARLLELTGELQQAEVLDLGTGPGDIPLRLAQQRPTWRIVGLDFDRGMLTSARNDPRNLQLTHGIEWVQGDVKNTGSRPNALI